MASSWLEEAARAGWQGADLDREAGGENSDTDSADEIQRWIVAYSSLLRLERQLLEVFAQVLPNMPPDAQQEAERTNVPILLSQIRRFEHRLEYWKKRKEQLAAK